MSDSEKKSTSNSELPDNEIPANTEDERETSPSVNNPPNPPEKKTPKDTGENSPPTQKKSPEPGTDKVDRLVKKMQKEEENLIGKLLILDKMEAFLKELGKETDSWDVKEEAFDNLNRQWAKIGRIPPEKNQETWARFHLVQDKFHNLRFANDNRYRQQIEHFLSQKKVLIKEAESLIDSDDLAQASRDVNKLHRQWKKIGNLPQKDENELWQEFKSATDTFNEKKSDNLDEIHEQEEKHLSQKKQLIAKAEELKESTDWDNTHQTYQKLMDEWKNTGPVPKRQSGKIWKQFKGAMDHFYDQRREHYKDVKKKRKGNLDEKKEILEKLKALQEHENPLDAVEEAKKLQEAFKDAGHVPIKHKNKLWKEYREVCDVIYDRYRAASTVAEMVGHENVADFSSDDIVEIKNKQKRADKLRGDIQRMKSELIQMEESLSYFKPSGKGSSLLDDLREKIAKAAKEIETKEETLKQLDKEIDLLTKDPE